jgi:hypothetical protein
LDAFALQAAIQVIRTGSSNIVGAYADEFKESDPKIWHKFAKKTSGMIKKIRARGLDKFIKVS